MALPWAMAACLVRPGRPVVTGDRGFLFSAQELETATRLGLHFTHVILRDNSYDMVRFQEELKYGRTSGVQLGDYDIAQYAGAFGAHGYRVETEERFAKVLGEALSREARVQPGITIIDSQWTTRGTPNSSPNSTRASLSRHSTRRRLTH